MTSAGLVAGLACQEHLVDYNAQTDTMYVGIKTFGIAGNVDGNGTPGTPDPRLTSAGGSDPANFGGDKSMALGFAPLNGGTFSASNPAGPDDHRRHPAARSPRTAAARRLQRRALHAHRGLAGAQL